MKDFYSINYVTDRLICYKYDVKNALVKLARQFIRKKINYKIKRRYTIRYAKNLVLEKKFAISGNAPAWFYSAFDRDNYDPLTNYALEYIDDNIGDDGKILVTGGGCGIMGFHLADNGLRSVTVMDLLPEVVEVGEALKSAYAYHNVKFLVDDCLKPTKILTEKYDAITALHWLFSAFMGNYGNSTIENPYDAENRKNVLSQFLKEYAERLNAKGIILVELIDACTDYRIYTDHPSQEPSAETIYPVRHSPEMVKECADRLGLDIVTQKMSVRTGHHPRTLYILQKK